jgi:leucyl-tRNA synthetase
MREEMGKRYDPAEIEPRWQRQWEADRLYRATADGDGEKYYFLTMLPYPSGDLHIGHWYAMTPSDTKARYLRMKGYNVLFPMGFDAFGLPAENAAIQHAVHPMKWTMGNIEKMRQQLRSMGAMFDWEREAVSCDPRYYIWSEWFFLKLYDMGLAYRAAAAVDFCPQCNTTLAREQVWGEDRHCERCNTPVIKKDLTQWFFRITDYAEELLDFSRIGWPERVMAMQTNWVGRSEGADVTFTSEAGDPIEVFTTRPDTLWGATFMVLAPEHPLVGKLTTNEYRAAVEAYRAQAARQSEIDRMAADKEKTGVFIGAYAINPVNGEQIPIWIADYVLMTYGSGAIMAVPAHDERDFEFALKFGLPIIPVIEQPSVAAKSVALAGTYAEGLEGALRAAGIPFEKRDGTLALTMTPEQADAYVSIAQEHLLPDCWTEIVGGRWLFVFRDEDGAEVVPFDSTEADRVIISHCHALEPAVQDKRTVMEMLWGVDFYRDVLYHAEYGTMIHSGPLTGTPGDQAKARTITWLAERGVGDAAINYRLHDWLISRQRYWGAPIPMIHCDECGTVPVPYRDLPVLLPEDVAFMPTGESPLKFHEGFLHTTCPNCGGPAKRETDTMDTFMCSSWYQYAYLSPYWKAGEVLTAGDTPIDPAEMAYWAPVDQYTGGIEHATMHLIYTRFFTMAMRDMGLVDFDEPMLRLHNQGMVLGEDGEKMSKSRGNVVAPDALVQEYGADTVRTYLMFFARWEQGGPWDSQGIKGPRRFLEDVWSLVMDDVPAGKPNPKVESRLRRKTHQTIRRVTDDLESFSFNTAIAAMMELRNLMRELKPTLYSTAAWDEAVEKLLLVLAPFAPHITEELWAHLGKRYSIHQQPWPQWDEAAAAEETITLILQVNGKVRDRVEVPADISAEEAKALALQSEAVGRHLGGAKPRKVVYVPGRLVNIVA